MRALLFQPSRNAFGPNCTFPGSACTFPGSAGTCESSACPPAPGSVTRPKMTTMTTRTKTKTQVTTTTTTTTTFPGAAGVDQLMGMYASWNICSAPIRPARHHTLAEVARLIHADTHWKEGYSLGWFPNRTGNTRRVACRTQGPLVEPSVPCVIHADAQPTPITSLSFSLLSLPLTLHRPRRAHHPIAHPLSRARQTVVGFTWPQALESSSTSAGRESLRRARPSAPSGICLITARR